MPTVKTLVYGVWCMLPYVSQLRPTQVAEHLQALRAVPRQGMVIVPEHTLKRNVLCTLYMAPSYMWSHKC
jgi:hypothetical protein